MYADFPEIAIINLAFLSIFIKKNNNFSMFSMIGPYISCLTEILILPLIFEQITIYVLYVYVYFEPFYSVVKVQTNNG